MAGHIQDRWYKTEVGADGKTRKVKTERYGSGMRYRARYVGPDGTEKSKSFPDRQKRLADQWLAHTEADMARGQYIDPRAARITFQQYAEEWVTHAPDPNTQASMESQLRLHAYLAMESRWRTFGDQATDLHWASRRARLADVPQRGGVEAGTGLGGGDPRTGAG